MLGAFLFPPRRGRQILPSVSTVVGIQKRIYVDANANPAKWRCQCGYRMLADLWGVISHMPV